MNIVVQLWKYKVYPNILLKYKKYIYGIQLQKTFSVSFSIHYFQSVLSDQL